MKLKVLCAAVAVYVCGFGFLLGMDGDSVVVGRLCLALTLGSGRREREGEGGERGRSKGVSAYTGHLFFGGARG